MSEIPKIAYLHFRSYRDLIINLYCRNFFFIESIDYVSLYLHDLFNQIANSRKNVVKLEILRINQLSLILEDQSFMIF